MMVRCRSGMFVCTLWVLIPSDSQAAIFAFTDQTSYDAMLSSIGYGSIHEGFEDDVAWGSVRSTISGGTNTEPSITSLGITWKANNSNSQITTGPGAARLGQWGFFTLPHGNPPTIGDGFTGTSAKTIYGVGGWIRTNTPPAAISLWLNLGLPGEAQVDFGGNNFLNGAHAFFGAINTEGFTRFDYLETEFDVDEQKFIFADDFTFATAVPEPSQVLLFGVACALTLIWQTGQLVRRSRCMHGSHRPVRI